MRIGYDSAGVWTIPILTPFQDIPLHVVQSPRIRRLLPDRMRPKAAVERIPGVVGQVREIGIIAVAEACRLRPEFHDQWAGRARIDRIVAEFSVRDRVVRVEGQCLRETLIVRPFQRRNAGSGDWIL